MRKLGCFLLIATLIATMILSGCSKPDKPESTVSQFFDASKSFDFEKMADCVNGSDRDEIKELIQNDDDEYQQYFIDYLKSNAAKLEYKVRNTEVDGDNATVTVDVKYIDGAPFLKATISEFFTEALPLAFSGQELTDDETSRMIVAAMENQKKNLDESFVEKSIEIKCVKKGDQWLIDQPSDELLDVLMSNFISAGEKISDEFDSDEDSEDAVDDDTVMGYAEAENMDIIPRKTGEEIEFATIRLKVNSVKEDQTIRAEYSDPTVAKEGAKFIILNIDVTNITNSEFAFSTDGIVIVDNKGREFDSYSDSIFSIDNDLEYRDLAPSIKENGNLVYELPKDATDYSLLIIKGGTNELYKIGLK